MNSMAALIRKLLHRKRGFELKTPMIHSSKTWGLFPKGNAPSSMVPWDKGCLFEAERTHAEVYTGAFSCAQERAASYYRSPLYHDTVSLSTHVPYMNRSYGLKLSLMKSDCGVV